jgi:hypothetical protein
MIGSHEKPTRKMGLLRAKEKEWAMQRAFHILSPLADTNVFFLYSTFGILHHHLPNTITRLHEL